MTRAALARFMLPRSPLFPSRFPPRATAGPGNDCSTSFISNGADAGTTRGADGSARPRCRLATAGHDSFPADPASSLSILQVSEPLHDKVGAVAHVPAGHVEYQVVIVRVGRVLEKVVLDEAP